MNAIAQVHRLRTLGGSAIAAASLDAAGPARSALRAAVPGNPLDPRGGNRVEPRSNVVFFNES